MAKFEETLSPFAAIYAGAVVMLEAMDDDQLQAFIDACYQVSTTNCWVYSYRAANAFVREAREIREARAAALTPAGDSP